MDLLMKSDIFLQHLFVPQVDIVPNYISQFYPLFVLQLPFVQCLSYHFAGPLLKCEKLQYCPVRTGWMDVCHFAVCLSVCQSACHTCPIFYFSTFNYFSLFHLSNFLFFHLKILHFFIPLHTNTYPYKAVTTIYIALWIVLEFYTLWRGEGPAKQ